MIGNINTYVQTVMLLNIHKNSENMHNRSHKLFKKYKNKKPGGLVNF